VRLLEDLHIAPRTVEHLRRLGHDVVRVSDVLPTTASDESIVARAIEEGRVIVTQDLDFSAIIALSGGRVPSGNGEYAQPITRCGSAACASPWSEESLSTTSEDHRLDDARVVS